jgi:hypothetical protein
MEACSAVAASAAIGAMRLGYLVRKGREFKAIDLILDPSLAVFGGMLAWMTAALAGSPEIARGIATSLGAWAGQRLIVVMEKRYLNSIAPETLPAPLDARPIK